MEKPMRVRLSWHSPIAYLGLLGGLLPYIILALMMTKRLEARIGICEYHVQSRRRIILLGTIGFILGIVLVGLAFAGKSPNGWLFFGGIAVVLFSLIGGMLRSRVVWPVRIERDVAWVKGACHEYMDRIPEFEG
jgi:hypothetical protein